jgi:arylsulfatase A-like enzyme
MNAQERGSRKRPNIVLMLTDNLGYGELGCYGGGILRRAPTPIKVGTPDSYLPPKEHELSGRS